MLIDKRWKELKINVPYQTLEGKSSNAFFFSRWWTRSKFTVRLLYLVQLPSIWFRLEISETSPLASDWITVHCLALDGTVNFHYTSQTSCIHSFVKQTWIKVFSMNLLTFSDRIDGGWQTYLSPTLSSPDIISGVISFQCRSSFGPFYHSTHKPVI